jgi:hypothetical protein
VRQIYALAAALCVQAGEEWPETRAEASSLIRKVRLAIGHPEPELRDAGHRALHDAVVDEFLVSKRRRRAIERT